MCEIMSLGLKAGDKIWFCVMFGFSLNRSKLLRFSARLRVLFELVILFTGCCF
jgi:hypothetical protein